MQKTALLACVLLALVGGARGETTKPFLPVPTPFTALPAPADPDHFTFVAGGDNRSPGHGYPMPPSLEQICREIGWTRPAFTLWTGDVIEGYGDSVEEADAEYDVFLKSAALTGTPLFNAPGNHEFSLDSALLPVYQKRMGSLYGSFDYGHSHFIALNTTPVLPDGTTKSGTIDDAQWAWLQSDLEANKGAANIFVMMHHYVFGPPDADTPDIDTGFTTTSDRDRVHALMVKYGVRAVFCGHNHIYWHQVKDGVDYFISGGAGAPLDASPEQGGYLHYLQVTVDGKKISTQILQPWHLEVDYPDGNGGKAAQERLWAANTNNVPVGFGALHFHLQAPPAGRALMVQAVAAYKKKTKPVPARIVSTQPNGQGVDVVVETVVPAHRTVEITVAPVSEGTAK